MIRASLLAAAVALLPAACQAQTPKPTTQPAPSFVLATPPPAGVTSRAAALQDAIDAVLSSPAVAGSSILAPFPRSVGSQRCDIRGGGPFPGAVVPGICRTEVEVTGATYLVTFTETWDASRFHHQDDPSSGGLRATWSFRVGPSGAVTPQPLSGNFPPQMVR